MTPEIAAEAGLRYATDEGPGIRRVRRGRGWSYHRTDGTLIDDPAVRERIASLAIPPAWTDVWIAADAMGHIQATGRDDRARKQYRYHPLWEQARDAAKFERLRHFGRALPGIREGVAAALRKRTLCRERVLGAVLALLEATGIRVGNDEYARENETYGLTTMRDRHVKVTGARIDFRFEAKGGQDVALSVRDRRLATIVQACQAVPGYEVFKWIDDDGTRHDVKSEDVNAFLQELSGSDFTAKIFRTWLGTLHAFCHLCGCEAPADARVAEADCLAAVDRVAERLRNTRAVARASYVHPGVLERYADDAARRFFRARPSSNGTGIGLTGHERALVRLLDAVAKDG